MTSQILNAVLQATRQTFESMLGCSIQKIEMNLVGPAFQYHDVTAMIGLSGEATGAVCLSFPATTACAVLERLLDLQATEIDDLVCDSMGELANMIGGGTKEKLQAQKMLLGLPRITRQQQCQLEFPAGSHPLFIRYESELGSFAIVFGFVQTQDLKILVVDPDPVHRAIIRKMAQSIGSQQTFECSHLQRGIEILQAQKIDLIFVANRLDDYAGEEFIRLVRRNAPLLPIVLLAEHSATTAIDSAKRAGISDHLPVPFTPVSLKTMLSRWMSYPVLLPTAPLNQPSASELIAS